MRVLITGATGLLGKSLIESANKPSEILGTYIGDYDMGDAPGAKYEKMDIRNMRGYAALFEKLKPQVVIHTAGVSSPDYAHKHRQESWEMNVSGTENIAYLSKKFSSKLIYLSSNGIYDGNNAPYDEEDKPVPVNYYGEIKLKGEEVVKDSGCRYAIVRPILMYGWNYTFERSNITTVALDKLKKKEKMFAYEDVFVMPLLSYSCAEVIWRIIREDRVGAFNISGKDRVSIYAFIKEAARVFGLDESLVMPVRQGFFKELCPRPADTSYKTDKMEKVLGIIPLSLDAGLRIMKEKLKGSNV